MATEEADVSLIGNRRAQEFLARAAASGTPAHALLFLGPSDVGKRTLACQFLATLLGRDWNRTQGLEQFRAYPDFSLLEREHDEKTERLKKNISIEQVRELRERLGLGSFLSGWKVAVIDGAEYLSQEAANGLLKLMEEPTPQTLILLIADERLNIPDTVLSRVQTVRFSLVPTNELATGLMERGVDRAQAAVCAGRAGGRPGLAMRLAHDPALRAIVDEPLLRVVSILEQPLYVRMKLLAEAIPEKVGFMEQVAIVRTHLLAALTVLSDAASIQLGEPGRVALPDAHAAVSTYAARRSLSQLVAAQSQVRRFLDDLAANITPKLILESLAFTL